MITTRLNQFFNARPSLAFSEGFTMPAPAGPRIFFAKGNPRNPVPKGSSPNDNITHILQKANREATSTLGISITIKLRSSLDESTAKALQRIKVEAFKDPLLTGDVLPPPPEQNNDLLILVAENTQGNAIGFILGYHKKTDENRKFLIQTLAVGNDYREKGLGSTLLETFKPIIREKGYEKAYLYPLGNRVTDSASLRNFYFKHGFRFGTWEYPDHPMEILLHNQASNGLGLILKTAAEAMSEKIAEKVTIEFLDCLDEKTIMTLQKIHKEAFATKHNIRKHLLSVMQKEDFFTLLIKNSQNDIIGFIAGYPNEEKEVFDDERFNAQDKLFHIDTLALKKRYQKSALGAILLDSALSIIRSKKYKKTYLLCRRNSPDKINLLGFYMERGFKIIKTTSIGHYMGTLL